MSTQWPWGRLCPLQLDTQSQPRQAEASPPSVSRTQPLQVHPHRCKPNQTSGHLIEPEEHCCGKIRRLVGPRPSTRHLAQLQSPSESQNSMWHPISSHPPVGQQHLKISEPVTGRGGYGGSNQLSPPHRSPEAPGGYHIGTKGRKLSLAVEEKAQCHSQEAFPAGLPTHHPRKSQTQASSRNTSNGPT